MLNEHCIAMQDKKLNRMQNDYEHLLNDNNEFINVGDATRSVEDMVSGVNPTLEETRWKKFKRFVSNKIWDSPVTNPKDTDELFDEAMKGKDAEQKAKMWNLISQMMDILSAKNEGQVIEGAKQSVFYELFMRMQGKARFRRQSTINYGKILMCINPDKKLSRQQQTELLTILNNIQNEKQDLFPTPMSQISVAERTSLKDLRYKWIKEKVITKNDMIPRDRADYIEKHRFLNFSDYKDAENNKNSEKIKSDDLLEWDMKLVPLPVLKTIYKELDRWNAAGNGLLKKYGWLDRRAQEVMFKHTYMRKDPTGIIYAAKVLGDGYMDRTEYRKKQPVETQSEIYNHIENLVPYTDLHYGNSSEQQQAMIRIFNRITRGEYTPVLRIKTDDRNIDIKVKNLGSLDNNKQLKQLIKNHFKTCDNLIDNSSIYMKENEFDRTTKTWKETDKIAHFRAIDAPFLQKDKSTSNIPIRIYGKGVEVLFKNMRSQRDLLDNFLKEALLKTQEQHQEWVNIHNQLKDKVDKDELDQKTVNELLEMFDGRYLNLSDQALNSNKQLKAKYRQNYFPTVYSDEKLAMMYTILEQEIEQAINIVKDINMKKKHFDWAVKNTPTDEWITESMKRSPVEWRRLIEKAKMGNTEQILIELRKELQRIHDGKNRVINYAGTDELNVSDAIQDLAQVKHLKGISGLFDIREGRLDKQAIEKYISRTIKTQERNRMVMEIAKLIMRTKSKDKRDYLKDSILKVALRRPDLPTRILGANISNVNVSTILSNIGIKVHPTAVERFLRNVNSYTSANLLWRPETAIGNMAPALQRLASYGHKSWAHANNIRKSMEDNPKIAEVWNKRIDQAGILGFNKHFIDYMTNKIRQAEGEREAKAVNVVLKELRQMDKNGDINLSEMNKKELNHTIKRIGVHKNIESLISKITKKSLGNKVLGAVRGMAKTEELVRTNSFIHAYKMAENLLGHRGEHTHPALIKIARNLVYEQDFMLAEMDFPMAMHGSIGNYATKLKPWQTQKVDFDIKDLKRAWYSCIDIARQNADSKGKKIMNSVIHLGTFFKELGKQISSENRQKNPMVAEFSRLLIVNGLMTALMEFLYVVPGLYSFAGKFADLPHSEVLKRATSPLLGLSFNLINMGLMAFGMSSHFGLSDDDELDDNEIMRVLRYTPIGVLPMAGIHFAIWLADKQIDFISDDEAKRWEHNHLRHSLTPILPVGSLSYTAIQSIFRE